MSLGPSTEDLVHPHPISSPASLTSPTSQRSGLMVSALPPAICHGHSAHAEGSLVLQTEFTSFSKHPIMSWTSWWSLLSLCILNTAVQGAHSLPTPCFLTKVRVRKLKEAPLAAFAPNSVRSHVIQMGMRKGCRKPDLTSDCQRSFPTQSLLQLHRPLHQLAQLHCQASGSCWVLAGDEFFASCAALHICQQIPGQSIFLCFPLFHGKISTPGCGSFLQARSLFQKGRFADGSQHVQTFSNCCSRKDAV